MFHVLTLRKKRDKNLRTAEQFPRKKENDFGRVRFDVVRHKSVRANRREPDVPSNGRNLTCPAAENQLHERNAHEFASRIVDCSRRVHVDLLAGFRPQIRIRPTIVHAENTNA